VAKKVIKNSTQLPISLTQAKNWLKIESGVTEDDILVNSLIQTACDYAELATNSVLVATKFEEYFDRFTNEIIIKTNPVLKVVSIKYKDGNGDTQTMSPSLYVVDYTSGFARITLSYGSSYPSTRGEANDVWVTFWAGYLNPVVDMNAGNDTLSMFADVYTVGDNIRVYSPDRVTYTGLSLTQIYNVLSSNSSSSSIQIESLITLGDPSDNDAALNISGTSTGTTFVGVIPEQFIASMLLSLRDWYDNREDKVRQLPTAASRLLNSVKFPIV
jgi:uncharacterized phiE125 gp8 family phage protein